MGERSTQRGLFEADHLYIDHVGQDSFYGFLASRRDQIFDDEDFADLYCQDNGRKSVAPSLLATALLLQTHDGVSDKEAKAKADFDVRWKVALGIAIEDRPFAKSTLPTVGPSAAVSGPSGSARQGAGSVSEEPGVCPRGGVPEEPEDQGCSGYQ